MNIEEDLTSLKGIVAIRKERCHGFIESDSCLISTKRLETLLTAYEKEKEKNKEYTMKINNLISQIESAIDFMKTDKLKIKVDMYQQKEEDLKLEIVHLKKLLKEE